MRAPGENPRVEQRVVVHDLIAVSAQPAFDEHDLREGQKQGEGHEEGERLQAGSARWGRGGVG
ncbi:MAG: hypothetical protein FJ279_16040 [Planctomycetes bacterium]|nr:hypothetical protein [Planctomycetota bacterium]MBM4086873.1 hypothetical protein [Planctomycetota bacterium]